MKIVLGVNGGQATWFEVNASTIDVTLFQQEREDADQEKTRKRILKALDEANKNLEKYGKFKTLTPAKDWDFKTVVNLRSLANQLGEMADWIQQSLEWAQRLTDGDETWEDICNKADQMDWYRAVVWDTGFVCIVGGSKKLGDNKPPTYVDYRNYSDGACLDHVVPLIAQPCS